MAEGRPTWGSLGWRARWKRWMKKRGDKGRKREEEERKKKRRWDRWNLEQNIKTNCSINVLNQGLEMFDKTLCS